MNIYEKLRTAEKLNLETFESQAIKTIQKHVGSAQVLLALSGGVDSSVCAALLAKAIPGKIHCIFVDHGLMRKDEGDEVERIFRGRDLNLIRINAQERFLEKLRSVTDPEKKRKIIGEEFIRVFEEGAEKLPDVKYLAQGTIYSDVAESGTKGNELIKSHHNVGGLPTNMEFKDVVEPLRALYKDEVRELGRQLGLSASLVDRQPFPGPGLAIRCIGEVTKEKLDILREADAIFREEIDASDIYPDQYFAALTSMHSVGILDGKRAYGHVIALRAIKSTDFMTAKYMHLPYELLDKVSNRIVEEVPQISRVLYDLTDKPPATVEYE